MARHWTFAEKLGAGFAISVALTMCIGAVAVVSLRGVVARKDAVIADDAQRLVHAEVLRGATDSKAATLRGYLLNRDEAQIERMNLARIRFRDAVEWLSEHVDFAEGKRLVDVIERNEAGHQAASDKLVVARRGDVPLDVVARQWDDEVQPLRLELERNIDGFVELARSHLDDASARASAAADTAVQTVVVIAVLAALFAGLVAFGLARALSRQIGTAVGQVQSSSAELQSAANQQVTGAKEQSTAMNEITTTISELLVTARQIADSARQVAQIAAQTSGSAESGDGTVGRAHESIAGIRRQVDAVVGHMLELGKKSQQIGAVLEIVSELAEQTNILAINATIEAAGAGDAGKRFGVVADEIRKLADRVAGSTKEIRGLIDDVRSAVNTTIMATETGSKAVDAGSRQFGEVAASFKQIASLVVTTTEAAREIELSTKQQTTAVEQVNVAIANVAQATRETEASSGQTLQTASQLASLSKDLLRLVQAQASS